MQYKGYQKCYIIYNYEYGIAFDNRAKYRSHILNQNKQPEYSWNHDKKKPSLGIS